MERLKRHRLSVASADTTGTSRRAGRVRLSVALTVLSALMLPAGAQAAWQSPVDLSAPGQSAINQQVAVDPNGVATAVWVRFDGSDFIVQARRIAADGTLGAVQDLSAPGQNGIGPQVAVDPNGVATAVWRRFDGANFRIHARRIAADGTLGATQDLSAPGQSAGAPQVTVDPAGVATAVWSRSDGSNSIVQARRIAADGTLGAVQDLSAPGQGAFVAEVAVDPNGVATAVWQRIDGFNFIVQARRIAADGTLGAIQDLSAAGEDALGPQVAADPNGVATVVWRRFDGSNFIIQARRIAADGTLGATQDLSAPGQGAGLPQVAVDPNGVATAVWHRSDGSNLIVQARRITADGTLGAIQDLSAAGQTAGNPQVAVDPNGVATAVWTRFDGSNFIIQARRIAADGTLGATQDLSAPGQDAFGPQVAVDPNGGAVAVWERCDQEEDCIVRGTRFIPPPVPPPPPAPAPAPAVTSAPPAIVEQSAPKGTARISRRSGCVPGSFRMRVRGKRIAKVTFYLNGKRIRKLRKPNRGKSYAATIRRKRLKVGPNKVKARVNFAAGSARKRETLRRTVLRCPRKVKPKFTG